MTPFLLALLLAHAPVAPSADAPNSALREWVLALAPFGREPSATDPTAASPAARSPLDRLAARIEAGARLDLECWRIVLLDKGYLRWRKRWPFTQPFAVSVHLPMLQDWLEIELVPQRPGWSTARATCHDARRYCLSFRSERREDYQELGFLDPDACGPGQGLRAQEIEFELRVRYATDSEPQAQCVGKLGIRVQPVRGIDEVLRPVEDPLWGLRLARSLRIDRSGDLALVVEDDLEWPATLACALDLQLVHDERTLDAHELWPRKEGPAYWNFANAGRELLRDPDLRHAGSLRVRGSSKRVLRDWDATSYWAGELEIPLAELIRH